MHDDKTLSRRAMMVGVPVAAMMPAVAPTANTTADDPVFAAIEKHRQATQATEATHELLPIQNGELSPVIVAALHSERNALLAWLTTPPTTMAGVLATLAHASRPVYDIGYDYECRDDTNLSHGMNHSDEVYAASKRFPAMIAAALRKLVT